MASKSLLFVGLLFAIFLLISSNLVSTARPEPQLAEAKGDVKVDGRHGGHHHHCHHPHCPEKAETDDLHEEAKTEATKSNEEEDGHRRHRCKHWPHC